MAVHVLFVCHGNICRSPTAEGVFRALVRGQGLDGAIGVDSAGTHSFHVGESPDARARDAALRRGVDLSPIRARKVRPEDFKRFDYVLAMDRENYQDLERMCPSGEERRLSMFLDFAGAAGPRDVPDPYYGGGGGFDLVLDLIEDASEGLLAEIRAKHLSGREPIDGP